MGGSVARGLLADVRPLRESPDYRRLWLGTSLSAVGGQMTTFAVALQVYRISHSSAAVGAVGLAFAVPAITLGLVGGVLIDSADRRRLVLVMTSVQALASVGFAVQAFSGANALWLLYALTAVQGAAGAINTPARRTFLPRLLRPELMPAGAVLTMVSMYVAMIGGPALAGVVTAAGGLKICYLVDALTFSAALYGVLRLPPMRPEGAGAQRNARAVLDGLRFIIHNRVLRGALLADLSATVLAMPIALFPAINAERFGGSPRTLGLLSTAIAVGGLLGSVLSGPVGRVVRPGRAMLVSGSVWGAALAGFGAVHGLGGIARVPRCRRLRRRAGRRLPDDDRAAGDAGRPAGPDQLQRVHRGRGVPAGGQLPGRSRGRPDLARRQRRQRWAGRGGGRRPGRADPAGLRPLPPRRDRRLTHQAVSPSDTKAGLRG